MDANSPRLSICTTDANSTVEGERRQAADRVGVAQNEGTNRPRRGEATSTIPARRARRSERGDFARARGPARPSRHREVFGGRRGRDQGGQRRSQTGASEDRRFAERDSRGARFRLQRGGD